MKPELVQHPLQAFTHRIVTVAAATLVLFSLATLGAVLWHMSQDAKQHAQHTVELIATDYGRGLTSALHVYTRPTDSHIWVLRGGHVIAKSPNAGGRPALRIHSGYTQPLNAYQRVASYHGRTIVVDEPLTSDDRLVVLLLLALVIGSSIGTLIIRGASRWLVYQTLRPVRSLTIAAERMQDSGTIEPLPVPDLTDEFYDLSVLLNRLLADLQERRQRERAQLADVTHHLRTPLTVIQGNLTVIQQEETVSPRGRAALSTLNVTLSEMKSLVADLLIMEQASNLAPELLHPMPYWDLVQDVVEYAEAITSEHPHIRLEVAEVWDKDTLIVAHPEFARRALWTIVDNAVKYCDPENGWVGILPARDVPTFSGVVVTNNGPEISPADMPHIFKRFYRGSQARDIPGSGLGLALARSLTRAQNGTIDVTSRHGSTRVTIRFRNARV